MKVKKFTTGYVVQVFDTETGLCVSQEFVAGDDVEWEDEDGDMIDPWEIDWPDNVPGEEPYQPFDMKDPE